jgi:hypothetical protein
MFVCTKKIILYHVICLKAKLLEEVVSYAKSFSHNIGHNFTRRTILLTAMTGAAAMEIGGETAASVFHYMKEKSHATQQDIEDFSDVRLGVIDEISFASYREMEKISHNLQNYTQCRDYQYGSIDLVILGDFCQLETIGGDSIYLHPHGIYWENELNCLVELKGGHRYKNCSFMQTKMSEIRSSGLSDDDRKILNSRVIGTNGLKMPKCSDTRFATYYNKKRSQINAEIFRNYLKQYHGKCTQTDICDSAIVIKCNAQWSNLKVPLTYEQRKVLFEEVSEADTRNSSNQKCDPLLCLFYGCHLMGNANSDVANGIANGTTGIFKKAHVQEGAILQPIKMHGFWVNAVNVDDVEFLELEWHDSTRFQGKFRIAAKLSNYVVSFPVSEQGTTVRIKTNIGLTQFPVVVNCATTGHKLQGKSMDSLVISEWSNVKNWAYVVISRVRTLKGLFFLSPIPKKYDFKPRPQYLEMMERLRSNILATPEEVAELKGTYSTN